MGRSRSLSRYVLSCGLVAACHGVILPLGAGAQQGIPGNDGGRYRADANAYRNQVRNTVMDMIAELGEKWNGHQPTAAARFYRDNATIVFGPDHTIEGRRAIEREFQGKLRGIKGVLFRMEYFDLSGDLAFIRGTMAYEVVTGPLQGLHETAVFTMTFRPRFDEWMIQTHTIAGAGAFAAFQGESGTSLRGNGGTQ